MIKETCIFDKYSSYYNIIGIISLFLILIASIIYYLYVTRKAKNNKKETFQNDGCFFENQGDTIDSSKKINVDMRDCEIYFTDKEEDCDKYYKYYEMTMLELDREILKENNNKVLYDKLLEIRDDKTNNLDKKNINQCKYKFNGWKELNKYLDVLEPGTSNIIYPHKNVNRKYQDSVYKNFPLLDSCFKEYVDEKTIVDIYTGGNTIKKSCVDPPINKLNYINNENKDQKYLSVNFNNSLPYNNIRESICLNLGSYSLNINNEKIFMKLNCYYDNYNKLNINNISFVNFNNNSYTEIIDKSIINGIISNMFRISYNRSSKKIYYGNKKINTNCYLFNYDMCNNISNYKTNNFSFTFKDFLIENKIVSSIDLVELINLLDANIDDSNDTQTYINDIQTIINTLTSRILDNSKDLNKNIDDLNKDINQITSYISNLEGNITSLQKRIDDNNSNIIKARTDTDDAIETLRLAVANAKSLVDAERSRISNLNSTKLSDTDKENTRKQQEYNDRQKAIFDITVANEDIITANTIAQEKIDNEYNIEVKKKQDNYNIAKASYDNNIGIYNTSKTTYDTQVSTYNNGMNNINNNFTNGLYFWKKDYNSGLFANVCGVNKTEIDSAYDDGGYNDNHEMIKIVSPREPFFHDNDSSYISLFEKAGKYSYFTVEVNGNIKFERSGYYHFFVNGDDDTDFSIGYVDPNNTNKMIWKVVSNYYDGHGPSFNCNTTKYPIYIDASYNGGYYGIILRFHELWGGAYLHPYFCELSSSQVQSIYGGMFFDLKKDGLLEITTEIINKEGKKETLYPNGLNRYRVNSIVSNNIKSLNLLNGNTNPFYVYKNMYVPLNKTDTKYKDKIENYIVYPPPITASNPGNTPPAEPALPTPTIRGTLSAQQTQAIPQVITLSTLSYTPLVVPAEYVDTSSGTIENYKRERDKTITSYQSTINNDKSEITKKNNDKTSQNTTKQNKLDQITTYNNTIKDNDSKLNKISIIKNNINNFRDFYDFDFIQNVVKSNIQITNTTYNDNVFEAFDSNDNVKKYYMFVEINF